MGDTAELMAKQFDLRSNDLAVAELADRFAGG